MNHELAKTLTTALVQFIDRERTDGTMCCSNIECGALEEAFKSDNLDDVEAFIQKKLSRLTEFEEGLVNFYNKRSMLLPDKDGVYNKHDCAELLHESAKELLAIAKEQLLSYPDESNPAIEAMADLERTFECNPDKLPGWLIEELNKAFKRGQEASHEDYIKGYANGYKDAEMRYNESVAYHYPTMPQRPLCYEPGGTCTNPHFDCINCPKKTTGGTFTSPNTASGTSAATLHGNTSVTDGKPHNPSFTD